MSNYVHRTSKQRGRIYLHLGTDVEIRVKPEEVDYYIKQGYVKGHSELAKERVRSKHLTRVWINNGILEKCVLPVELDYFLSKDYSRGKLPRTKEHCEAIRRAMRGRVESQETRNKKSIAKQGRTWKLVNGKRVWSKRLDKNDLLKY